MPRKKIAKKRGRKEMKEHEKRPGFKTTLDLLTIGYIKSYAIYGYRSGGAMIDQAIDNVVREHELRRRNKRLAPDLLDEYQ